ncbi:MAG: hypothetical protein AB7F94_05040 [Nitrospira sp.]
MAKNIERVNYYEREYLRSFDFEAEQRYHIEMRRRLNLALHRWGIVFGLQLEQYKEFGNDYVRVLPGIAVDAHGREILLIATHTISDDDFRSSGIMRIDAKYSVWIEYSKALETPPSAGYRVCDLANQYTRWRESAKILIRNEDWPGPTKPEPLPFEELSDDPQNDGWPLFLGHMTVAGLSITYDNTTLLNRRYIGLRAQNIITPHNHPTPYDVLQTNAPKKPSTSLEIDTNTFINDNLVIGSDFTVPNSITPTPPTQPVGNAKVSSDLYLNGRFYINKTPKTASSTPPATWTHIDDYIKAIVPKITPQVVIGSDLIVVPSNPSKVATYPFSAPPIAITTTLGSVSGVEVIVGISGIRLRSAQDITDIAGDAVLQSVPIFIEVAARSIQFPSPTHPNYVLQVNFTVGPTTKAGPPFNPLIQQIQLNYTAIFRP